MSLSTKAVAAAPVVGSVQVHVTGETWLLQENVWLLSGVSVVLFTVAIAFILAGLNVYYRDVRHALPLVIQLWMFATPIVYPLSVVPEPYRLTYTLFNPMAAIIDGYRRVLVRGLPPEFVSFALAALTSVLLVLISYRAFKYMERSFADVV